MNLKFPPFPIPSYSSLVLIQPAVGLIPIFGPEGGYYNKVLIRKYGIWGGSLLTMVGPAYRYTSLYGVSLRSASPFSN